MKMYYDFLIIVSASCLHKESNDSLSIDYLKISSQNYSSYLVKVVENLQTDGILDPQFCYLLQSFLDPQNNMIKSLELPMHMDPNAARFRVVGTQIVPVSLAGNQRDPIFELFNPPHETGIHCIYTSVQMNECDSS